MPDAKRLSATERRARYLAKKRLPIVPAVEPEQPSTGGGTPVRANEQPYGPRLQFATEQGAALPPNWDRRPLSGPVAQPTSTRTPLPRPTPALSGGGPELLGRAGLQIAPDRRTYGVTQQAPISPLKRPIAASMQAADLYSENVPETAAGFAVRGAQRAVPGEQEIERKYGEARRRGVPVLQASQEAYQTSDLPFGVKGALELALDPANALPAPVVDDIARVALRLAAKGVGADAIKATVTRRISDARQAVARNLPEARRLAGEELGAVGKGAREARAATGKESLQVQTTGAVARSPRAAPVPAGEVVTPSASPAPTQPKAVTNAPAAQPQRPATRPAARVPQQRPGGAGGTAAAGPEPAPVAPPTEPAGAVRGVPASVPGAPQLDPAHVRVPDLPKYPGQPAQAAGQPPTGKPPAPPTGGSAAVPPPPNGETPVQKLTRLIREAKPAREETQELYSRRRRQQAAVLRQTFSQGGGEETLNRALGSLKGPLPRAQFEAPKGLMTPDEARGLYEQIWTTDKLKDFERVSTGTAFRSLFAEGRIPTRSELEKLERVFGKEFVEAVLSKRSLGQKTWENFVAALGIPRAILSSFDLSAPFRQGAMLVGEPTQFGKAFVDMLRYMRSDAALQTLDDAIRANPHFELAERSDLYIAPIGRAATLAEREEAFMTHLASRIPGINLSQRAYVGFLNSLRARTFFKYADLWGDAATPEQYAALAKFINGASGRGTLGALEQNAHLAAQVFFSPRFLASRLQAPLSIAADNPLRAGPSVSRIAAKNLTAFIGLNVGLLSMAKASGVGDLNLDPRSADFGKARVGNTRIDFFAGYTQLARLTAMMMSGTGVTGATGRPYEADRLDVLVRFVRTKLAPIPGFLSDLMAGSNLAGEELHWDGAGVATQAGDRLAPMNLQTLWEAVQEYGAPGAAFAIPSTFGAGVSTYQSYASQADITAARKAAAARLFPGVPMDRLTAQQDAVLNAMPQVRRARRLQRPKETPGRRVAPTQRTAPSAPTLSAAERRQRYMEKRQLAGAGAR